MQPWNLIVKNTLIFVSCLLIMVGCAETLLRSFKLSFANAPLVSDPVLHHVHPKNYRFIMYAVSKNKHPFSSYRKVSSSLRVAFNSHFRAASSTS